MQRVTKAFTYALALSLIAVTIWAAYQMVGFFILAEPAAKAAIITAIAAVATFIYNNNRQHSREIKSRQFPEKSAAYKKFFDLLFEMIEKQSSEEVIDPQHYASAMRGFAKDIMVWGSADVINEFNRFIRNTASPLPEGDSAIFLNMERVMRSLRKDLGHNDNQLEKYGVTKLLVKGEDHADLDPLPYS